VAALQISRRNVTNMEDNALRRVPPVVVVSHVEAQAEDDHRTRSAKASRDDRGHDVVRSRLRGEDVGRDETHGIGSGDQDGGEDGALVLVEGVVVVPGGEERGGDEAAGAEEEAGEVAHSNVRSNVDGGEDDEANTGDHETGCEVNGAVHEVVGGEGGGDDEARAHDVGRHVYRLVLTVL